MLLAKKCGIEAHQAFTPRNVLRFRMFFTSPPRMGVAHVRRFRLTDTDEAQFSLVKVESKKGYAFTRHRVRDPGHYTRSMASVNLLMTVEAGNPYIAGYSRGSVMNPRKWWRITMGLYKLRLHRYRKGSPSRWFRFTKILHVG